VPRRRLGEYLARFQATPEFYDEIACMLLELMAEQPRRSKSYPVARSHAHFIKPPKGDRP